MSSIILALGFVIVSAGVSLFAMAWGFALKCDDGCSTFPGWQENPDSWQWNALGALGVATFVFAVALLGTVSALKRGLASLSLLAWTLAGTGFLVLFGDSGLTDHVGRAWAAFGALLLAGLGAIVLASRSRNTAV